MKSPEDIAAANPSSPLRRIELSPGVFGAATSRRVARGEVLVSFQGFPPAAEKSRYSIQIAPRLHIVTRETSNYGPDDFINHGCSPNAFLDVSTLNVVALRDLEYGEEVLLNYCATEEELVEPFRCDCQSPDCYGEVKGFRFLSRPEKEALKEITSPWLREKYGLKADIA